MTDRSLIIQIQVDLVNVDDIDAALICIEGFARNNPLVTFFRIDEKSATEYINFELVTANISQLWMQLRKLIYGVDAIKRIADGIIIVCEGYSGWDDYILLFHFDPSVSVETLPTEQ